ncbi:AI-2E family transporter [Candidatus Uhrbacteria bacterium]|nr:AI-2E family transporter [Candidatus Uhrbacteria bacterium]
MKEISSLEDAGLGLGPPRQPVSFQISVLTIVKIVLVLAGLYLLYLVLGIIIIIFVSLLLAALIDPLADWFQKRKIPRGLAVLVIYIALFAVLALIAILLVPPILTEFSELAQNFGTVWERLTATFGNAQEFFSRYGIDLEKNIQRGLQSLEETIAAGIENAFGTVWGFFGGLLKFLMVLVLTFYMVVEEGALKRLFRSVAPEEHQPYLADLLTRMQQKIGLWLRGQITLMIVVGVLTYVGLLILGVDYALVLGLLAGLAEIIPYVGPIVAAVPAVIIAFSQSWVLAIFAAILAFAIQQLENNLLVPKIMQRAVGLNPIVSIVALLVGARLGNVLGAILAIPVATAIAVVLHDVFKLSEDKS